MLTLAPQAQQAAVAQDYPVQTIESRSPGGTEISPSAKVELTEFVMQDLEFTLLTWKAPSADLYGLETWLNANELRLQKLKFMAQESKLDSRVESSIAAVESMVASYKEFLSELDRIHFVDKIVRRGGSHNLQATGPRIAGSFIQASQLGWDFGKYLGPKAALVGAITLGVVSAGSEAMRIGDEARERDSKSTNMDILIKNELPKHDRRRTETFSRKMDYLKATANSLKREYPEVPGFTHTTGIERIDYANSPFPHVAKAYGLVSKDRILAARQFAAAADAVPQSVGIFPDIYAQYYKAPYQLLAGHLFEYESRIRGDSKLVREAVLQFDTATQTLGNDLSAVSYPYLIAYARALAVYGQSTRAQEIARYIYKNMPSDSLTKAARSYDLACVYSLLGDQGVALGYLRDSYRAKPRRDPQALKDPLLAGLVKKKRSAVEMIAHNPLVGVWRLLGSEYHFYVDGSFLHERAVFRAFWNSWKPGIVNRTTGKWAVAGDSTLRLFGGEGVPDSESKFSVNGDILTLTTGENVTKKWKRESPAGILDEENGMISLNGRKLDSNGSWVWFDGSKPSFARFTRMLSKPNSFYYWYTYEDPLVGRVDQHSQGETK